MPERVDRLPDVPSFPGICRCCKGGYHASEFLNARRKKPTPYTDGLRLTPMGAVRPTATLVRSDEDLDRAVQEGKESGRSS